MKKALLFIAISISLLSCDKKSEVKELKTAYVDTAVFNSLTSDFLSQDRSDIEIAINNNSFLILMYF